MTAWRRILTALAVALLATPAAADIDVSTRIGHDGRWIAGCATPVAITLRNDGTEAVSVSVVVVQHGGPASGPARHSRTVFVAAGTTRREPFILQSPPGYGSDITLELVTEPSVPINDGTRSASRGRMTLDIQSAANVAQTVLSPAGRIVGVIGDTRSVLASLLPNAVREKLVSQVGDLAAVDVLPIDPDDLKLAPFVLDGLDALVVVDPDGDLLADRVALDGVLDWVALGGTLVVSPGAHAAGLGGTPLGPHLPPTTGPPQETEAASVLDAAAKDAKEAVKLAADRRTTTFLRLAPNDDVPLLAVDRPLWADRNLGAGRVRLLAFDACAVLRAARDPGHLVAVAAILAGRPAPIRDDETAESVRSFRFGSDVDLDGSVATILRKDAFDPPPLIVIVLMLALYVAIVGPLDWIILRRMGRQRLTTLTFGGAVIVFTVVAYGASFFVFSAGSVLNRIVLVDLADGGRGGRQVMRVQDLVGYYSPRGSDQTLEYSLPAVLLGSTLPGGGAAGEVGTAYPVLVDARDPLGPVSRVQVAFRSQRVVRTVAVGVSGRTIETEWLPGEKKGDPRRLRIVNGLPVDLVSVDVVVGGRARYSHGPLAAGATAILPGGGRSAGLGSEWLGGGQLSDDPPRKDVARFLGFLSRLSPDGFDGGPVRHDRVESVPLERQAQLARTGVARGAALTRGRCLVLAVATECPLPLPGRDDDGETHVLIRKEIDLK